MKIAKLILGCMLSITLLTACASETKVQEKKINELRDIFSKISGFNLVADIDGGERGDFLVKISYECEKSSRAEVISPDYMKGFTLELSTDKMIVGSDGTTYELKKEMATAPANMTLLMAPVLYDLIQTGDVEFSKEGDFFTLSGNYTIDKLEISVSALFDSELLVPTQVTVTAGALKVSAGISDFETMS